MTSGRFMRLLLAVLLIGILAAAGCSSPEESTSGETSPVSDELAGEAAPKADAKANTSEADLQSDETKEQPQQPADKPSEQQAANEPPPAAQESPAPAQEAPPQPEVADVTPTPAPEQPAPDQAIAESPATEPTGPAAKITALNFDGNLNGGTVLIRTSNPVQYTTRSNASTNQYIIELQNTTVPRKFQRPYVTKEFNTSIASINAYQAKGPFKVARIVIQFREPTQPQLAQDGNVISLNSGAAGGEGAPSNVAQNGEAEAPEAEAEEPTVADEAEQKGDSRILSNRSMDDFLTGNTKFYGRRISIEVKDADIKDVFRLISEESGLNIIVSDEVTGKVSLRLKKIPWDQALTVLLQSRQLGYVKAGSILRIAPLRALRAESDAARDVLEAQKLLKPMRVQIFPISYAKADEIEAQAKEFISARGKVKADKRTNSLIATDIDENIQKIKKLIARLDTQTPQVLIEAKIVEARESFERSLGVSWRFSGAPTKIGSNSSTGAPVNLTPSLAIAPGIANQAASGGLDMGLQVGTFDLLGDLQASLKLLENERLVKVISSPRIVTLDRIDADIEQTTQFPVFNSSVDARGTPQTSVTFQDVKLQLLVKPQITAGGGVIMDVTVIREFPDAVQTTGNGSQARAINKRKATTQVLVENGDTVVIGGIYQSDVTDSESGVPFLRKIPILGALFRSKDVTREKNELVIFLTPRILNKEQAFVKPDEEGG